MRSKFGEQRLRGLKISCLESFREFRKYFGETLIPLAPPSLALVKAR
jgi:hypothetical protein